MNVDVVNFLEKLKEYSLTNELFLSNSLNLLKIIDDNELKNLNKLDEKEFTERILMFIYKNNSDYEIKKYNYLRKLKDNNNPYLDIIESIIDCYEIKLNDYFLKLDNKSSRKMTIFDLLDLFANAKSREHADYAFSSLDSLFFSNVNNLYDILKTITFCESEKCSYYLYSEINNGNFNYLNYCIKYFPRFKNDDLLNEFYHFFSKSCVFFQGNRYSVFTDEKLDEFFNLSTKIENEDAYKFDFLERIFKYIYIFNISSEEITKILKCNDFYKVILITKSYEFIPKVKKDTSTDYNENPNYITSLVDTILGIENNDVLDILYYYSEILFTVFSEFRIDPLDFFSNISKINDSLDVKLLDYNFMRIKESISSSGFKNKAKKMVKFVEKNN